MSLPADINDRYVAAAVKAEGASEIMRRFSNEPEGVNIQTESGPVPSLAEWLRLNASALGGVPVLKEIVDGLVDPAGGASLIPWSRSQLSRAVTSAGQALDAAAISIWEYATLATGYVVGGDISLWDWRPAIQAALDDIQPGETLHFPAPHIYRVVNATGVGATIEARRADAVLSGTLYALTCAADRINVRIDGDVHGTSALDDIFRLTGQGVNLSGQGVVRSVSGEFLDTNNQTNLTVQWFPALVRLDGSGSGSRGLTYYDQPTVGLRLLGDDCWADRNTFIGGPTAHGAGTILFGIYAGAPQAAKHGHIITRNKFGRSTENGACYSGIFMTAQNSVVALNVGESLLEHLVYNYGRDCKVLFNYADDTGVAAAYQNFAPNALFQGNTAKNCLGAFQSMYVSGLKVIGNHFFEGISLSGIALRTAVGVDPASVDYDVEIASNTVAVTGIQSPIDISLTNGLRSLSIHHNILSGGPSVGASGREANIRVTSAAAAGLSRTLTIHCNVHRDCAGYAITVDKWSVFKIFGETICNANGTAVDAPIRVFNCIDGEISHCTVEDTRTVKLTARIALAQTSDGNARISMHDNNGIGLLASTAALCLTPAGEISYNNHQNSLGNIGLFTMTATAALTVNAGVSSQAASIRPGATVLLEPINKAAVDQQAGSKRLYVSTVSSGSFGVATSDGTGAVAATYAYRIIQ